MTADKLFNLNIAPHSSLSLSHFLSSLSFCLLPLMSALTALKDQMQVENPVPVWYLFSSNIKHK